MEIKIRKGKILVYRVYDIGSEINLETAEALLADKANKMRFRLDRKHNMALIISSAPLSVHLGTVDLTIQDTVQTVDIIAKIWHFGTVSLCFQVPIIEGTSWPDLVKLASWIENDVSIDEVARISAKAFQTDIWASISVPGDWETWEDYVTYYIQEFEGLTEPVGKLGEFVDIPALILSESKEILSDSMKRQTMENIYQYSRDDFVVVDWNSALVIEPSGSMDVPLVIEFALNQLLEMRYYDDLLDQRLNTVYNEVVGKKKGMFSNKYKRLAEEAGQFYLEISEIVENVENSFKTVGDFYLATIFRGASKRFRFDDWQKSINEKLGNMAEISKLLHSEVSESRNQTMEFTIVVLIAIEVIPFLYKLFVS